jgi:hypothetical protein
MSRLFRIPSLAFAAAMAYHRGQLCRGQPTRTASACIRHCFATGSFGTRKQATCPFLQHSDKQGVMRQRKIPHALPHSGFALFSAWSQKPYKLVTYRCLPRLQTTGVSGVCCASKPKATIEAAPYESTRTAREALKHRPSMADP